MFFLGFLAFSHFPEQKTEALGQGRTIISAPRSPVCHSQTSGLLPSFRGPGVSIADGFAGEGESRGVPELFPALIPAL